MDAILEVAVDGAIKSQIMYRANLSFRNLHEYLSLLLDLEMLTTTDKGGKEVFVTTPKGVRYIQSYREIEELLKRVREGICQGCGKKISPDFRLCPYCGRSLHAVTEVELARVKKK
jgi:predicted transcriptional regulator